MLPNVLGISCTDSYGRIYYEYEGNKRLIARAPKVPEWISDFDLTVFKRFLDAHWECNDRCLIVLGHNTYREAKKIIHQRMGNQRSALLISSRNAVTMIHPDSYGKPAKQEVMAPCSDDSLQNLRVIAYKAAIEMHADKIIVLGGNSVYQAFSGCYDLFLSCVIHSRLDSPSDQEKRLEIKSLLHPQKPKSDSPSQGSGWMHGEHKMYKISSLFVDPDYTVEEITSNQYSQ